jgi:hypothetical protein
MQFKIEKRMSLTRRTHVIFVLASTVLLKIRICGGPQGKSHGAKKWNNGLVRVVLKSPKIHLQGI